MLTVYADGSSSGGKNRPGGFGWVIVRDDLCLLWGFGGTPSTTNNLMEMEAIYRGLEALLASNLRQPGEMLDVCSDSQYALGIASNSYSATLNLEQTQRLREICVRAQVTRYRWVKGHNGHKWNEVVDQLAHEGKLQNTPPSMRKKATKKTEKKARSRKVRKLDGNEPGAEPGAGPGGVIGGGVEPGREDVHASIHDQSQDHTGKEGNGILPADDAVGHVPEEAS